MRIVIKKWAIIFAYETIYAMDFAKESFFKVATLISCQG